MTIHAFVRRGDCAKQTPLMFVLMSPRRFDGFDGLLNYMRATWFGSTVWPVECWSIYGMSIRTNNDVEGNIDNAILNPLHIRMTYN